MAFEKVVKVGDREITVFELTVAQVRDMAKAAEVDNADPLSNWLIEDTPFVVIAAMSSVKVEELDEWRPSEIKQLADVCREVNPDFFAMSRRISAAVEKMRGVSLTETSPP